MCVNIEKIKQDVINPRQIKTKRYWTYCLSNRQKKYLEIISMNNEDRVTLFCSFYDTPSGGECQVILQMIKRKYHFIWSCILVAKLDAAPATEKETVKALVDSMVAAFYKQASDVDRLSDEQRDQFCDQFKTFLDSSEYSNIAEEVLSEFADATRFEHSQDLLDFIQKVIFRLQCFEDTKVKREATIPSKVAEKRPLISTNLILGFFIICFQ